MNAASSCHEISGVPGLYVDAFRGRYLEKAREDGADRGSAFILTHYHGDHYGSLPRENNYAGPAKIHCTPVTARLLRLVHEVPEDFVVEHPYGETWSFRPRKTKRQSGRHDGKKGSNDGEREAAKITFYDANHCPGAAIVLIELPDGKVHLHTGDMRYHEKMKAYPLLRDAATNRRVDCVLLDTTYANPKHDFVAQEAAVDAIASQVQELVVNQRGDDDGVPSVSTSPATKRTIVLLSCYSIGKERVLWEASKRTGQLIYVSERKLRMLHCIDNGDDGDDGREEEKAASASQIVHRTTRDPRESDVHVIPMGMAGEMWPFFQPNYKKCAEYANELETRYDRVVAFIPTGWADATNWNKKNAVSRRRCGDVDVEIRLIAYSEHSAFSELQAFVEFLNPRKVIPTVFKDENDMRRIEARFPVDSGRAKRHFFSSMTEKASTASSESKEDSNGRKEAIAPDSTCNRKRKLTPPPRSQDQYAEGVASLIAMGFEFAGSRAALEACDGNVELAIEQLLGTGQQKNVNNRPSTALSSRQTEQCSSSPASVSPPKRVKGQQQATISSFFRRKGC